MASEVMVIKLKEFLQSVKILRDTASIYEISKPLDDSLITGLKNLKNI